MKILGVGLTQTCIDRLRGDGYHVANCEVKDEDDLWGCVGSEIPDIVLVNLDECSWLTNRLQKLRQQDIHIPFVGIGTATQESRAEQRADFLAEGGNDFLGKPVFYPELVASIDSLHRLHSGSVHGRSVMVRFGEAELYLDMAKGVISVNGVYLKLTSMEYKLLELLMLHRNQLVKRATIENVLYGYDEVPDHNSIQVLMFRIRGKLSQEGIEAKELIKTIREQGYCLG